MKLQPVRGVVARQFIEDSQEQARMAAGGLLLASLIILGFASKFRGRAGSATAADDLPGGIAALLGLKTGVSMDTGAGLLDAWIISLTAPLVLCALALPLAIRAIAGCEARGEMEWLAAQPVHRTQIVVERFIAIAVLIAQAALPATILLVIGGTLGNLDLDGGIIVSSMIRVVVLVSLLSGIVLVASVFAPDLTTVAGVAVLVPVIAFGLILGGGTASLSPVRWTLGETPAAESSALTGVIITLILTAAVVAIAASGFKRRDISL